MAFILNTNLKIEPIVLIRQNNINCKTLSKYSFFNDFKHRLQKLKNETERGQISYISSQNNLIKELICENQVYQV